MQTRANLSHRSTLRRLLLGLCCLVPLLMGGCPEFRNDVVGVLETATRSALLGTDDEWTIRNAARVSLIDVTIDLIFDQLLAEEN